MGQIIGANQVGRVGKCAITLHSCISVTDRLKNYKQNKSIATGPFCVHAKFEAI